MDSKQIQDLIELKQHEIDMLKNDLAVQELLRGIHFEKLENNILKDVRIVDYLIHDVDPTITNEVCVSFLLNNKPISCKIQYSKFINKHNILEKLCYEIIKEIGELEFKNKFDI